MWTKEEYEKFCDNAENMKIYDGRNTYDLYECENVDCCARMVTTYADKGVTPFVMICPKCGKAMEHSKTFYAVADYVKVTKFVRPTYEQYCNLSPGTQHHIEQGGLVLETELTGNKSTKCF